MQVKFAVLFVLILVSVDAADTDQTAIRWSNVTKIIDEMVNIVLSGIEKAKAVANIKDLYIDQATRCTTRNREGAIYDVGESNFNYERSFFMNLRECIKSLHLPGLKSDNYTELLSILSDTLVTLHPKARELHYAIPLRDSSAIDWTSVQLKYLEVEECINKSIDSIQQLVNTSRLTGKLSYMKIDLEAEAGLVDLFSTLNYTTENHILTVVSVNETIKTLREVWLTRLRNIFHEENWLAFLTEEEVTKIDNIIEEAERIAVEKFQESIEFFYL